MWNIFRDPEFVDAANLDFSLKSTSPCIDAGDPGLPWIDGSFPDIGALPYSSPTTVDENRFETPNTYALIQNYPNPFNPSTTIDYQLPVRSHVRLTIYDLMGREVATLVHKVQNPDVFSVSWNAVDKSGKKVPSGVYIYKLSADSYSETKKLILMR